MMNPLHEHVTRALAGEPGPHHTDAALPALVDQIRRTVRDSKALEALGRHTLAQVNAGLRTGLQAQKVVLRAQQGPDDA